MSASEQSRDAGLSLERRADGIAVIRIESPDQRQNTLGSAAIDAFGAYLDEINAEPNVAGLIIASGKPGSFIAGADIGMINACGDAGELTRLARTGQALFDRLASLDIPVVAAINGVCLGGGLELALACHARISSDDRAVQFGVPEVKLGLLPGSGGTQRLPRRIGAPAALDLMMTGRQIWARKAARLGLVDEVVPAAILESVASDHVRTLAARRSAPPRKRPLGQRLRRWLLEGNSLGRRILFAQARRQAAKASGGHYPAPPRIIDCVETGLREGMAAGLQAEAHAFGELGMTPEAAELLHIYFVTTAMKKDRGVEDPSIEPRRVQRAAVLGAGLMGAGISTVTADRAAVPVRLKDVAAEGLSTGLKHINKSIDVRRRRGSISDFEATLARRRVTPTLDFSGFGGVDLVIEAVFEDLDLKHRMIEAVESHCHEDTIFASNTSSLPITDLASGASRPGNVIGMHYFSPVERMPLLEVIAHPGTDPAVIATAVSVGRRQGKTPIVVNDGAGFYVNRILAPYLNEAIRLVEEGVLIERIDQALVRFGFPVGPLKLLDEVGIDISAHVAPVLERAFGERMQPVAAADRMVEAGRLGRKSGRGFYRYDRRWARRSKPDPGVYELLGVRGDKRLEEATIVDRCLLPMLNEAARCLDDRILRGARDGDIGAVYGIGFPPFRGGPFRYIDCRGADAIVGQLQAFAEETGKRHEPSPALVAAAETGRAFHPRD